MNLLDIHTHQENRTTGEAIICKLPSQLEIQPGNWYAVGIHPWEVAHASENDFADLAAKSTNNQILAIGETGYDRTKDNISLQNKFFEIHIHLADEINKPVIIHAVRANDLLLSATKRLKPKIPLIVHGFRGKQESAMQLLKAGFYLSFGEKYNVETLRQVPLDRLFLETDESLLDIHHIYNKIAQDLKLDVSELEEIVRNNIQRIFFPR